MTRTSLVVAFATFVAVLATVSGCSDAPQAPRASNKALAPLADGTTVPTPTTVCTVGPAEATFYLSDGTTAQSMNAYSFEISGGTTGTVLGSNPFSLAAGVCRDVYQGNTTEELIHISTTDPPQNTVLDHITVQLKGGTCAASPIYCPVTIAGTNVVDLRTTDLTPFIVTFYSRTIGTCAPTLVRSRFNKSPIAVGDPLNPPGPFKNGIWFNAVLKASGRKGRSGVVNFANGTITFTANGTDWTISVPPSTVTFSPTASTATTSFNGYRWSIVVPASYSGDIFVGGRPFLSPGLPGRVRPVEWSQMASTNISGLKVHWRWSAAVYTTFQFDMKLLGVKPVDSPSLSAYLNGDPAGTPESFKAFLTAGGRGTGGTNYTGSPSQPRTTKPCVEP